MVPEETMDSMSGQATSITAFGDASEAQLQQMNNVIRTVEPTQVSAHTDAERKLQLTTEQIEALREQETKERNQLKNLKMQLQVIKSMNQAVDKRAQDLAKQKIKEQEAEENKRREQREAEEKARCEQRKRIRELEEKLEAAKKAYNAGSDSNNSDDDVVFVPQDPTKVVQQGSMGQVEQAWQCQMSNYNASTC